MARRENLAITFLMPGHSKEISVFVDESGSFDESCFPSRYYVVCLVFHDQDVPIAQEIAEFDRQLQECGLPFDHCVHAGPLIRREREYAQKSRDERRIIFTRMLSFARRLDISYRCFAVDKKFIAGIDSIHDELLRQMVQFLLANAETFDAYDKLKIYYDNGQGRVKKLLQDAFAMFTSRTEFIPEVTPGKYRLFQVADMICTLELTRIKLEAEGHITESEKKFFVSIQNLKKHYLKPLARKEWR